MGYRSHRVLYRRTRLNAVELRMFDGSVSSAGLISHYLDIGIQPHAKYPPIESRLNVTKLHGADIVLGSNWMIRHGIRLDLAKRTISLVAPSQVPPSIPQSGPAVLQATSSRRGSPCTYPNNIVLPSQPMWTPSPNRETPTSSSAPSIAEVPRTESIRAVVVGPYDEDPTTLPEYQPTEPQFIEPLDTDEYEKETKELLSQVPSQHHEYLDIFRKKGGTETLPPPRPYDMRIDLLPSAKLAVAKLYQLTEDQRMILLDTLKRETEAGRIRPSKWFAYVFRTEERRAITYGC